MFKTENILSFHTPVLLKESIDYLNVKSGEKYIDCTLGGGGHSGRIAELGGKVLSIDQDEEAIAAVAAKFQISKFNFQNNDQKANFKYRIIKIKENWKIVKGNFANIEEIAKETGFTDAAGILFDLGVSSHQLEDKARGFSFDSDAELDMRMDKDLEVKASDLIKILSKKELYKIFRDYGEEEKAWNVAVEIVKTRKRQEIRSCRQLSDICRKVGGSATKVFQALRIQINDELGSLRQGLIEALSVLKSNGRIVVISFHSLEDRIVKNQFKDWQTQKLGRVLTEKPISPQENEIEKNTRARSAKMRVFEKI